MSGAIKSLSSFLRNWTVGDAAKVITYNVKNGLDMWRKLYHNQLPQVEHRKQLLHSEFNALTGCMTLTEMKEHMA